MQVFNNLHIVGRNDDAKVTQGLHLPTLEARDTDSHCMCLSSDLQGIQNVLRISASTYCECDIVWLHKIPQLFRKHILITGVVCPRREGGKIIRQGEHAKPLPSITISRAFSEITSEV